MKKEAYLTTGQVARMLGVHIRTLAMWGDTGAIPPHHTTPGGHRRYTQQQVDAFLHNVALLNSEQQAQADKYKSIAALSPLMRMRIVGVG